MKLPSYRSPMVVGLLSFLLCALPAVAQYNSGLEGTVLDPSGSSVPDVQVAVTNQDTGVVQTTAADSQGLFRLQQLPAGLYRVEIRAMGFVVWKLNDIRVEGNQTRTIYPKLVVGQQQQSGSYRRDWKRGDGQEQRRANLGNKNGRRRAAHRRKLVRERRNFITGCHG